LVNGVTCVTIGIANGFGVSPILTLAAPGPVATSFAHPVLGLCFAQRVRDE